MVGCTLKPSTRNANISNIRWPQDRAERRSPTRFPLANFDAFSVHVPVIGNVTLADGHIINAESLGIAIGLTGETNVLTAAFDAPNMKLTVTAHEALG